jgi:hypothetical protein
MIADMRCFLGSRTVCIVAALCQVDLPKQGRMFNSLKNAHAQIEYSLYHLKKK